MSILQDKTVWMETTAFYIYMPLMMNNIMNMAGVVQEAGTANLSEAPEFTQFL